MPRPAIPLRRAVKAGSLALGLSALLAIRLLGSRIEAAQERPVSKGNLDLRFGKAGLEGLTWHGVVLESAGDRPGDGFEIGHMKITTPSGRTLTGGDYDWGENAKSKEWDATKQTWLYRFGWGSIAVQFVQDQDRLDIVTTATNLPNSGIVLDGATVAPVRLRFPMQPKGFTGPHDLQLAFGTDGPNVTVADFGSGEVAAVVPGPGKPLYTGFVPAANGDGYRVIASSTTPDGLANFQPHFDRPLAPGQTDSYTLSLRFAPSGTPASALAGDALHAWAEGHPMQLHWDDRRPLGTVFLASSPGPNASPDGANPRRYFTASNADFDVRTPAGLERFQERILRQAQDAVVNLRKLGAQGVVTWDLEGEQYPQDTSYVCAPDTLAQAAPEMESVVAAGSSPYKGMHLADAYFKTFSRAGLRVGVCVRPQRFTVASDGLAHQQPLDDRAAEEELRRKIQYAHDRWGATLFYVDSSVRRDGTPLSAAVFQHLHQAFPDSLIMPEESTFSAYAYTAPFQSFLFHGDLGTSSAVKATYPQAFSVNLINDAGTSRVEQAEPALVQSVRTGDVLMGHAGFWSPENTQIQNLYTAAGLLKH